MDIKKDNNVFYIGEDRNRPDAFIRFNDVNDEIEIVSTFTNPENRGQGLAKILTEHVAKFAEENNKKIVPICSYAVKFFRENEKWQHLVKDIKNL